MLFADFIQKIIQDLKLGNISDTLQKTLEFKIGEIVDAQVEEALKQTLTEADWKTYEDYQKSHPEAPAAAALTTMIQSRPEIKRAIEDSMVRAYVDVRARGEAVEGTLEERGKAV